MGRPSGALSGDRMRRRHPQDWELRDPRFEELESEDDGYGQGVILDPHAYAARNARARGGFMSDELYFDGYDLGQDRISRRGMYDQAQFDYDSDELEYREQRGFAFQQAVREKEEALIQSAMARIARARAKGKTHANLTPEEVDALERRKVQQPEQSLTLASPPATPAKNVKGIKATSRSTSSTSLASKSRKRGGSGLFGTNSTSPAKSNSKVKVNRKPSPERALPYPTGQTPQAVVVQGPDGPMYAPIGYYGPPSPELIRAQTRSSQPSSRSASKHNRRESTPPERTADYVQYPLRYPSGRPDSSGSNRSLPDDIDWYPPPPAGRNRSSSNVMYPPTGYPTDYEGAFLPAAQGRRNVSGPPDVRYSNLRRVPPSSPLAQRPVPAHASHSEPTIMKRASGLSQQVGRSSDSSESSTSSDDAGVQVDFVQDSTSPTGYTVTRMPMSTVVAAGRAPSGNEGRRRKDRK